MKKRSKKLLVRFARGGPLLLTLPLLAWLAADIWQRSTFTAPPPSTIVTDRTGAFMAQLGGGPAGYGYWPVTTVPHRAAAALLALEDRRFWDHPGVDPVAVFRAARADLFAGRRVSGASTLAMQVARMQHPEARNVGTKFLEAAAAVVMTARYGREAVLKQYLLLVPMGQNTHGIGEASSWYFNRPADDLSWAQIAFLAAIPQSPSLYNPAHAAGLARAKTRARLALARLRQQGVMDQVDYAEALDDLATLTVRPHPARRPDALHAILQIAALTRQSAPTEQIHATIDLGLQAEVTKIARLRLAALRPDGARQMAVLVADRQTMNVLALVGSQQYAARDAGEIDYALRWRSPGSTLKPFIFAQALDRGAIFPTSVLQDAPDSGTGVDNADRRFLGPLLPAQALANSRNVPAASLVRLDGLDESHWFLAQLGLDSDGDDADDYGLTLAIGGMPTELSRLVAAYGALANDGVWHPLRWYAEQPEPPAKNVLSLDTARTITLFLSDPMARLPSFSRMGSTEFPFPVAVKTGTSQGYRDAWVVEFTDKYVVGVWVGRPDGAPMDELGGATSAALIGQDVLLSLYKGDTDGQDDGNFAPPPGTAPVQVCAATGRLASTACAQKLVAYLPAGFAPPPAPPPPPRLRIVSPLNHSEFLMNPDTPPGLAVLPLRAAGAGGAPVEWMIDGQAYQMANGTDTVEWPVTPGRHVFQAVNAQTHSRPVVVLVVQ